jgi:hypothetical protein
MSSASEFPFVFTPAMRRQLSRRVLKMLHDALRHFPELEGKIITVGFTTAHLGSAVVPVRAERASKLTIRLRVKRLSYSTIGHELTHLLQGLSRLQPDATRHRIPGGEKQCDVWTLARSSLFCDDAPTYIKLPRAVRDHWPTYARSVRRLCVAAVEKRKSYRFYIRWLEAEIKNLARKPVKTGRESRQLQLPF